ncbi:TauD/TfdA family dioxygenase [Nonomuraea sp. JJY05]|uniref:TauD/TfdA family dioxygenase n=1 Tax=Nonomuraea sp. JJY05 TaxID=3350255 RepID=UPI00373F2679
MVGPTAWTRDTLRDEDWLIDFADEHRASPGVLAERVALALGQGPGLVVVRGWPADGVDLLCGGLGPLLGAPRGAVNLVRPMTGAAARRGMTDQELALHTDRAGAPGPPRLLGLLCLRAAAYGGHSLLASGHTVYNRLLAQCPHVVDELRRDFHFGAGSTFDRVYPVFQWRQGRLRVHYNRLWIERSQQEAGKPLTAGALAALEAFEAVLSDPAVVLRFRLRPGDLLLPDNTVILHGRTAFTDSGASGQSRCLARLWLD